MSEPVRRPLPPSVFARLADATRYLITGVSPDTWFGPLQPLAPMAPPRSRAGNGTIRSAPTSTISRAPTTGCPSPSFAGSPTPCRCSARSSRPAKTRSPRKATRCARATATIRRQALRLSTPSRASSRGPTAGIRSPTGSGCCSRTCWSSTRRPSIRATIAAARSSPSTSSTGRRSSP